MGDVFDTIRSLNLTPIAPHNGDLPNTNISPTSWVGELGTWIYLHLGITDRVTWEILESACTHQSFPFSGTNHPLLLGTDPL